MHRVCPFAVRSLRGASTKVMHKAMNSLEKYLDEAPTGSGRACGVQIESSCRPEGGTLDGPKAKKDDEDLGPVKTSFAVDLHRFRSSDSSWRPPQERTPRQH